MPNLGNTRLHWFLLLSILCSSFALADLNAEADVLTQPSVSEPEHRLFRFNNDQIIFSNRFNSARLNGVKQMGKRKFLLRIEPENTPINNSPWYSFNVVASKPQKITLLFQYRDGDHRYHPKISHDGRNWQPATNRQYSVSKSGRASLKLRVGPDKLWISAQELNYSAQDIQLWMKRYAQKTFVEHSIIGQSVQGRPIEMLTLGNPKAKQTVVLIGRQHPPEVTGTIAQLAFVRRLSDDSELSKRYREKVKTLIIPLMNPDGVINGHWRHNINGVDLNRDWYSIYQPEIKAASNVFKEEANKPGQSIRFALDFHSTHKDIFYSVNRELTGDRYDIVDRWVGKINSQFPDYFIEDRPGNLSRGVSKNWFYRDLNVPALTYEVGDHTPRNAVINVADFAATAMMELLLEKQAETH